MKDQFISVRECLVVKCNTPLSKCNLLAYQLGNKNKTCLAQQSLASKAKIQFCHKDTFSVQYTSLLYKTSYIKFLDL